MHGPGHVFEVHQVGRKPGGQLNMKKAVKRYDGDPVEEKAGYERDKEKRVARHALAVDGGGRFCAD